MALLAGAALLGLHFAAAAFSQMPLTPMKIRYFDEVAAYLEPYSAQNWMLFAPDPVSENRGILARARCRDGSVTSFHDVTTKYIAAAQSSRFFPPHMSRLVSGNMQQLSGSDPVLARLRESERAKKKTELPLMPYEKTSQDEALRFVSRYALTQLPARVCGDDAPPEQVQVRMYIEKLPPWSQRHNPAAEGKLDAYDMDWLKAGDLR
ncbi:hypothetical protein J7E96_30705 [Streptomyces sp. ISL-96]|uniref:DUF5819 family protein n=1 Tax=Streptomyces sp. ISL-96 TaxID=2819191 RepID=UPI001BE96288|nr:DUF5819 family protein [Streptomyces sp. ISL-96]MBT2492804.1 hypothetical protein [Streptomyces sp. ISL-96]